MSSTGNRKVYSEKRGITVYAINRNYERFALLMKDSVHY